MSKRKSRNRRTSNVPGFLNENTNVIANDDPLWADRTSIRPSTSLVLTRNASSILNSSSATITSPLTDKWYNYLSQSNSFGILEAAVRKNVISSLDKEHQNIQGNPQIESESDQEPKRKRTKLRLNQNQHNKNNVFIEALDKSTSEKNPSNFQIPEQDEGSESTVNNSPTHEKLRSKILKTTEKTKQNTNKFDVILHSNNTSEKTQGNSKNLRFLSNSSEKNSNEPQVLQSDGSNELISDNLRTRKKLRPRLFRTAKQTEDNTNKFDNILEDSTTSKKMQNNAKKTLLKRTHENINENVLTPGINIKIRGTTEENDDAQNTLQEKQLRMTVISNTSFESLRNKSGPSVSKKKSDQAKVKKNNGLPLKRKKSIGRTWLNNTVRSESDESDKNLDVNMQKSINQRMDSISLNQPSRKSISALRDVQNTLVFTGLKKSHVVLSKMSIPESENSKNSLSITKSNKSQKSKSIVTSDEVNESLNMKSTVVPLYEHNRSQILEKTNEKDASNERNRSGKSLVETSDDEAPRPRQRNYLRSGKRPIQPFSDTESSDSHDDLLQTPAPTQSTLNNYGKPLARVTEFSFSDGLSPKTLRQIVSPQPTGGEGPPSSQPFPLPLDEDEDIEVDVENDSDGCVPALVPARQSKGKSSPVPTRQSEANKICSTTDDEGVRQFLSDRPPNAPNEPTASAIDASVWAEIKKKTDALKERLEASQKRQEDKQQTEVKRTAVINAKLKRRLAQIEVEKKQKQKKPIDKAFLVNGRPYKQPRLPRPKRWVTSRLYKHLWKCMEPRFGLQTRVKSEKFVLKLSNVYTVITRRKKYDNYKAELDDLQVTMAKFGIVETRYDFWRFCREFMPPVFNDKVIPMMLPGNKRNIPFDKDTVFNPILNENRDNSSTVSESSSEKTAEESNIQNSNTVSDTD